MLAFHGCAHRQTSSSCTALESSRGFEREDIIRVKVSKVLHCLQTDICFCDNLFHPEVNCSVSSTRVHRGKSPFVLSSHNHNTRSYQTTCFYTCTANVKVKHSNYFCIKHLILLKIFTFKWISFNVTIFQWSKEV